MSIEMNQGQVAPTESGVIKAGTIMIGPQGNVVIRDFHFAGDGPGLLTEVRARLRQAIDDLIDFERASYTTEAPSPRDTMDTGGSMVPGRQ